MDYSLTDNQKQLIQGIEGYCAEYFNKDAVTEMYRTAHIPDEATKAWVDAGYGLLGLPEKYGGAGADRLTVGLSIEAACRYSGATLPFINNAMDLFYLSQFGTDDQVSRAVEAYRETGCTPFALGISEPQAGSDTMNMSTYSTRQPDGSYLLNGTKTYLALGTVSPAMLILAKDEDPARDNSNISMWLVPRDSDGVLLEPMRKMGQQIIPTSLCTLTDVRVTEADRLGEAGGGFLNLMKGLETERCFAACVGLGLSQAAMDDAARYASEHICFGKPIGNYQLIQEKLCDMETKIQASRNWVYRTLWDLDNGISVRTSSALMKRFVSRSAFEVADDAMQILGGPGYTEDTRVGRIWADTRGNRFGAGTDEIMVHIAGRQLVKQYKRQEV